MITYSLVGASNVICSNNTIKEAILKDFPNLSGDVHILKMPIDTELLARAPDKTYNKDLIRIASIASNFSPEKGLLVTLNAFARLVKNTKLKLELLIVGTDEHPEKNNLKTLTKKIETLNIKSYVKFTGQLSNNKVAELLSSTDIFISSRLVGNFSTVILEALFAQCIIVASDSPGNCELIEDGENGLLYSSGNAEELYIRLLELVNKKEIYYNLSVGVNKWRSEKERKYGLDFHTNQLLKIFQYTGEK